MNRAFITGAGNTRFGRVPGLDPIELMHQAGTLALDDAGLDRGAIDGLLCGYATTLPHLMMSTLLCERLALSPIYAHQVQLGGATGGAMIALASDLVRAGRCRNILVVAGENRLSGQSRDVSMQTLAQVGDAEREVPNGASVPAYYALLASRYLHETGAASPDLAQLAVLMRRNASNRPDAHLSALLTAEDVLTSRPVALPLRMLDCCPISDGGIALVVSAAPGAGPQICIRGSGQAHLHQHLSAMKSVMDCGARQASALALSEAGLQLDEIDYAGIYDSFTITLMMLLEEIGLAPRGQAGAMAMAGHFDFDGALPLNTHGGLLSFGHCGVGGGMAHMVEAVRQLGGRPTVGPPRTFEHALVHADGGVMSSHVSIVLSRVA